MSKQIASLNKYMNDIQKIIDLADERREEYWSKHKDGEAAELSWKPEDLWYSGKEMELLEYISSLDYEEIKTIQTIMYIGRDASCMQEDGTYNYFKTRECMDKRGWNKDKKIEAMQMVEKVPLADYLRKGCKKINLM